MAVAVAGPSAKSNQSPETPLDVANQSPETPLDLANQSPETRLDIANRSPDLSDGDFVLRDDYLELDDLAIPLSRTTSSADSSCMTMSMTSEEYFDSDALLRELGDDTVEQESKDSIIKLNLSAPAKLKQVVVPTATLGMPYHLF